MRATVRKSASEPTLLEVSGMDLNTPAGRPLFRSLNMSLGREQVAVIGRNGVGKSSLLDVLAGRTVPNDGVVAFNTEPVLVPQAIEATSSQSLNRVLSGAVRAGISGV